MYHFPSNNLTEKQLKLNNTLYIYHEKTKQTLQSKEKNTKALYLKNKQLEQICSQPKMKNA